MNPTSLTPVPAWRELPSDQVIHMCRRVASAERRLLLRLWFASLLAFAGAGLLGATGSVFALVPAGIAGLGMASAAVRRLTARRARDLALTAAADATVRWFLAGRCLVGQRAGRSEYLLDCGVTGQQFLRDAMPTARALPPRAT